MASPTLGKHLSAENQPPLKEFRSVASPSAALTVNVLDQIRDGVFAADLQGNITGLNSSLLQIYGYSPEELIGSHLTSLCPEEEQIVLRDSILPAVLEKGRYQGELRTRTKSGRDVYVYLSLSRLGDSTAAAGIAGILIDVTEQKRQEVPLKQICGMQKSSGLTGQATVHKAAIVERQVSGIRFVIASAAMHKFMVMVDHVAANPEIVLISGETGSGKELIARTLHDNSARCSKPFVDINCAALPEQLVESELFGYEKGAFSGADSAKPGLFELANQGTLFLDEIGELDSKLQVKLLRVLDGFSYYRLGGHRKITVDVRIVAATNQDLESAVEGGRFRRDLFHRLGQIQLHVPPLRERPEDVVALAEHFLRLKNSNLQFGGDALSALACYRWPGNVRELRNLVAKVAMTAAGPEIGARDLFLEVSGEERADSPALPITNLEGMEEQMIIKALEKTGGRRGLAAEQLGISRRTLSRKLREYNITSARHDRERTMGSLGSEQQKVFRAKTRFLVRLRSADADETNVTAVNLSTGGLGLEGLTDPRRFQGLLDTSFLLPDSDKLIQAKVRLVWADAAGHAGVRFVVLEPALYEEIHHWTAHKMAEEGWECSSQNS